MSGKGLEPWQVKESDFPGRGNTQDRLRFLLRYAILAPSGHNSQPWVFRIQDDAIELAADVRRDLPVVDPNRRELVISCGAALGFLRIAAHRFGYHAKVVPFPDSPTLDLPRQTPGSRGWGSGAALARVSFRQGVLPSSDDQALFKATTLRRTNRMPYDERLLPPSLLQGLAQAASAEGAWLQFVPKGERRDRIAEMVEQGSRALAGDPKFRRELAAWIRSNWSGKRDGMPGYAFGAGMPRSFAMPFLIRTFDWGKTQGTAAMDLALAAPELAVLGTPSDTPQDWLKTGQALSQVLLRARAADVSAHFLNQPVQVPDLRARLPDLLGRLSAGCPQLVFRMGFAREVRPTPRRRLDEVLAKE
ncbi:MAG: nitroreductase [SAR202 cluster bacterium]|nr:nitroreductase [SAR202 cluster bacterium]